MGGTAGAEWAHLKLPAENWGISRAQLTELATFLGSRYQQYGEGLAGGNPAGNHPGCKKPVINNGIDYLVQEF